MSPTEIKATTTPAAPASDDTLITYQAAALYLARSLYDEALKTSNPAEMLDQIADALPDVMPEVFRLRGTAPDLADVLRPAVADRVWAYAVVERARAEADEGYGYVFGLLADCLRQGGNPAAVRADALRLAGLGRNGDHQ